MTIVQDWARERNLTKGQILAIASLCRGIISKDSMLQYERELLQEAFVKLKDTIFHWKEREELSRTLYLKKRGG